MSSRQKSESSGASSIVQQVPLPEPDYRSIVENSPDFIIRYDDQVRICFINQGLLAFLALDASEVIGKLPAEVWPDGRYVEIEKAVRQVLETNEVAIAEFYVADSSGGEYFKQVYVVPDRDDAGQVKGAIAFGRSISSLREAEHKLRRFIDSLPGIAYTFRLSPDGHGSFPFISSGITELYGLKAEDVKHDMRPIHLLAHPDDRSCIEAAIAESARSMTPYRVESRVCRPGLPERWLETTSIPECDGDGGILWHGIMLDITARKHLEADQQEHLRRFQSMDRINRAMQGTNDLEQMMHDVLDVVLSVFDCDRAFLVHPREPDDVLAQVPMERTKPEYPGAGTLGMAIPLDEEITELLRITRDAAGPVQFGLGTEYSLPHYLVEQCEVKSLMMMVLHPKVGRSWIFGVQRCVYARVWSRADERLLQKIAQRLQDGLTSLLMYRDLSASEQKFRSLAENLPDGVVRYNRNAEVVYANHEIKRYVGNVADVMAGTTPREHHADGSFEDYAQLLDRVLASGKAGALEKRAFYPNGEPWVAHVRMVPERDEKGDVAGVLAIGRDITEYKHLEAEQRAHLHYFESMDRVNRAIQGTNDLEQLMRDVLDVVLELFDCDRAFFLYPCDPEAAEWRIPMERTKPEYPGALARGMSISMQPDVANVMRIALNADGPVKFGPGSVHPLPDTAAIQFNILSKVTMALRPKLGKPWQFGIHQCTHTRVWSHDEVHLLQEIGRRLQDALTSLLMYRDLSASEQKFRSLAESMPDNIVRYDKNGVTVYVNPALERTLGDSASAMIGTTPREYHGDGEYEDYAQLLDSVLASGKAGEIEKLISDPDGEIGVHQIRMIPERGENGELVGVLCIGRDVTEQKREEEIRLLAYHDTLTSLPNRRLLTDRLEQTMSASKRSRRYVALMFIDLDNFKSLNDMYGHGIGDLLLIEVARRIIACVREADTVARFGGDEFVVLLSDLDIERDAAMLHAEFVAEKIRNALAEPYLLEVTQEEGKARITVTHHCTSSIGVVVVVNHEATVDNVLKWADAAMYQAKESGRNQVCFYNVEGRGLA